MSNQEKINNKEIEHLYNKIKSTSELKTEFKKIKILTSILVFLIVSMFFMQNIIYISHILHFDNKTFILFDEIYKFFKLRNFYELNYIVIGNIILFGIVVIIFYWYLQHLRKIFKNILTNEQLIFKNEKELLSNKIIRTMAENLHHEIKTPLNSLINIIKKYELIIEIMIEATKENNFDLIKKIVNGEKGLCEYCPNRSINSLSCQYYIYFDKNLKSILNDLKKGSKSALANMQATINITKSMKSLKNSKNINLFDVIEQSIILLKMLKKYKFNYKIDSEFKSCYLNGLSPDIMLNILINHIKNSLEAHANFIYIKFIRYEVKQDKNFITLLIIDNGNGIPKDKLEKIYELDFSTKGEIRGTGLYLSKQLLNFYGGDENVVYTGEEGTAFELIIPVKHCNINTINNVKNKGFNNDTVAKES